MHFQNLHALVLKINSFFIISNAGVVLIIFRVAVIFENFFVRYMLMAYALNCRLK